MQVAQLPLSLKLRDDAIFENFFVGKNAQLIDTLKKFIINRSEPFVYCYGEKEVGRTHLLQACCHLASIYNQSVFYISLSLFRDLKPAIFDNMESQAIICLDDVDAIMGNLEWEEALFHFYNRVRQKNASLLISAQCAPHHLHCILPDLKSRLSHGLIFEIKSLTEAEKMLALQMRAEMRGLCITDDVADYLIRHFPRSMQNLFAVLDKLDQASLVAKRKLTIPFVKMILSP